MLKEGKGLSPGSCCQTSHSALFLNLQPRVHQLLKEETMKDSL